MPTVHNIWGKVFRIEAVDQNNEAVFQKPPAVTTNKAVFVPASFPHTSSCFLPRLLFDPEGRRDIFFRYVHISPNFLSWNSEHYIFQSIKRQPCLMTHDATETYDGVVVSFQPPLTWILFIYLFIFFRVGCLHPVACTRLGSGFPSNAIRIYIL
jgi:hypothetical protein